LKIFAKFYKNKLYIRMLQCFSFATLLSHSMDPCKLLTYHIGK
jgi:hypothetical protein